MPSTFRTGFCAVAAMLFCSGAVYAAPPAASPTEVAVTIRNHTGVPLAAVAVRGGVPLARGVLRDGTPMRLLSAEGTEVPCRVRSIAHWHDGSVKWLLVDAQVDLRPDGVLRLRLLPGKPGAAPKRAVTVHKTADALIVDTGAARFQFPLAGFGLPGAAWVDLDADGRAETQVMAQPGQFVCEVEHRAPGPPTEENWLRDAAGGPREKSAASPAGDAKTEVESANDLHAVIKLSGWQGARWLGQRERWARQRSSGRAQFLADASQAVAPAARGAQCLPLAGARRQGSRSSAPV